MIKKLLLLTVIVISISCSSSDDSVKKLSSESSIIGVWQLTAEGDEELNSCKLNETITFSENGDVQYYYVNNYDPNCEFSTQDFTFTLEDDILTFYIEGQKDGGGTYIEKQQILILNDQTLSYQTVWDNEKDEYADQMKTIYTFKKTESF
ncbi:lipocalin family protein [Galbibacter sp. BG1]